MPDERIDLIDHIPQFVWTTGRTGIDLQYANRTFLDFLGHPDIHLLSDISFWSTCMHPDDLAKFILVHDRASDEMAPYQLEARLIEFLTGTWRWHFIQGAPRFGPAGEYLGYIGTAVDISIRKIAELKLMESENRFRIMAEGTEILIAISDESNNAVYFNSAWAKLTGRPVEQLLQFGWADLLHPDDRETYLKTFLDAAQQGVSYSAEFRVLNKDGGYTWLLAKVPPRIRLDGTFAGHISSCIDITDRKQAEQQLKAQETLLENLVRIRTSQLEQANADIQQFVHVASHDLKEPIRKIKVFLSRIFQEWTPVIPETISAYLKKMQDSAGRMTDIINGTLNYITIDDDQLQLEWVNLNEMLHNIRSDLEIVIHEKHARFSVADLPDIQGNQALLYQLFYNLINNSLKFARKDIPPFIWISCLVFWREGMKLVRIEIKDNGIGFHQGYAERIFHPFVRLNAKDRYEGGGLGLTLCKKIIGHHKGSIRAQGMPQEGAVFSLTLPVRQSDTSQPLLGLDAAGTNNETPSANDQ